MSARHKSEPAPVVPDEVIDPPTKSATPHEPAHEQMAFDWPVEVTDIITRALRLMTPEQLVKVVKNGIGQYATATPARGRGQVESRLKK